MEVVRSRDPKVPPRLRLAAEWRPSRDQATGRLVAAGRLWDFTEKIASSRREGKNRRDGATVSTRVLRLTDDLGRTLFEEAKRPEVKGKKAGGAASPRLSGEEAEQLQRASKEGRRRRSLEQRSRL